MKPVDFVHPYLRSMHGYVPGLQTDDPAIIKLNTNENPFPVSESVVRALIAEIESQRLQKYPDPVSSKLREALARRYKRPAECFLVGNGSDEILSILFRAVLSPERAMVTALPTYSLYPVIAGLVQAACIEVPVRTSDWRIDLNAMIARITAPAAERSEPGPQIALCGFANPNAPTGIAETRDAVLSFARTNPVLTLIDEAYAEFGDCSVFDCAGTDDFPRLIVSGTASKSLSLAGGRIGWLCAAPDFVRELEKIKDSYNVSRLAQTAALAAVEDTAELNRRIRVVVENRSYLTASLRAFGFETLPSSANFIFTRPPAALKAAAEKAGVKADSAGQACYEYLLKQKILVRYWNTPLLRDWVRITIGTGEQMQLLVQMLSQLLQPG
jgi:histidinol-phosphate aminotransferase